ncbi:MAG: hypothetical protein HC941_20795 [Microcoleus sp. SU_5_3]|nr:hypothetical protein [Microcoleus sp. SU_5_3]
MHQELGKPPQFIDKLSRKAMQFAMFWAFLWMPSSCNRLVMYVSASSYHPVSFKVTDAVYNASSDSLASYWLTGTVEGREERLIPHLSSGAEVNSSEDILKFFPKGTDLPAIYNPAIPGMFFQGESLRLRYDNGKFWESEVKTGSWVLKMAFIPIVTAIALNKILRFLYQFSDD